MQNKRHGSKARQILTYFKKKMIKNGGFLGLSQPFEVYLVFVREQHKLVPSAMALTYLVYSQNIPSFYLSEIQASELSVLVRAF